MAGQYWNQSIGTWRNRNSICFQFVWMINGSWSARGGNEETPKMDASTAESKEKRKSVKNLFAFRCCCVFFFFTLEIISRGIYSSPDVGRFIRRIKGAPITRTGQPSNLLAVFHPRDVRLLVARLLSYLLTSGPLDKTREIENRKKGKCSAKVVTSALRFLILLNNKYQFFPHPTFESIIFSPLVFNRLSAHLPWFLLGATQWEADRAGSGGSRVRVRLTRRGWCQRNEISSRSSQVNRSPAVILIELIWTVGCDSFAANFSFAGNEKCFRRPADGWCPRDPHTVGVWSGMPSVQLK